MPWMLPESVVSGVLMSACASTHTTHASGCALSVPEMLPIACRHTMHLGTRRLRPAGGLGREW